jgi:hypothetical protein
MNGRAPDGYTDDGGEIVGELRPAPDTLPPAGELVLRDSEARVAAAAVSEKVGTIQTTAELLRQRAGDAVPADLLPLLDIAPDVRPETADEQ